MLSNISPLAALANIISSGVHSLESAYSDHGIQFPSLDEPYSPGPLDDNDAITATTNLIIAAAHQLIAGIRAPIATINDYAPSMYTSSALGLVIDVDVPDALKDEPAGLHVNAIGAKVDVDPGKLARVLRYLATRHVFREVTPNVFANNRISSALVKSRPFEQLKANNLTKYDDATAAAFAGVMTDEGHISNSFFIEHLRDAPKGVETPFQLAFKTKATLWEWYEEPSNRVRGRRFANAMAGDNERFPKAIFTGGFDWNSLEAGSVVVDVGDGVGSVTLTLVKHFPQFKYVVQDLPKVIGDQASKYWEQQSPQSISEGTVTLQTHSFFGPQPVKDAAVYFMRMIIHDWADAESITIMKHLRAAAGPSSKLIIFDMLMLYACPDPAGPPLPPYPLLANLGLPVGGFITAIDLHVCTVFVLAGRYLPLVQMLNLLNGQERTASQFAALGEATGWKLEGIKPGPLAALMFSAV
ncbi:S-adenosyl-L-methionine-dependent methyltransferase [Artomyces pyxidatus]|uniref:S-adenosyl-L-methionine-dependent methyltransferase n=1 Tax=Artomyces pyxidatus TaxID=48021 RepID=A0ACB8T6Z9_9AGAM|nr:S-adenosyl-L-methionine-dependent methyltransferase [Artomyces pyxidatus]